MFDDPTFDGASYLTVGGRLIEAARERPTLGIALARDRDEAARTREWFVGTRVSDPGSANDKMRFDGGAPPLAALAHRVEVGEFGDWFETVKAGVDSGRLQRLGYGQPVEPRAKQTLAVPHRVPLVELVTFEAADDVSALRCRTARR